MSPPGRYPARGRRSVPRSQSQVLRTLPIAKIYCESTANSRLQIELPAQSGAEHSGHLRGLGGILVLDDLQPPLEIAGLDRPNKGVDHCRYRRRLARGDFARGE